MLAQSSIVVPDQKPAGAGGTALGTLFIPNTLGLVGGAPHLAGTGSVGGSGGTENGITRIIKDK